MIAGPSGKGTLRSKGRHCGGLSAGGFAVSPAIRKSHKKKGFEVRLPRSPCCVESGSPPTFQCGARPAAMKAEKQNQRPLGVPQSAGCNDSVLRTDSTRPGYNLAVHGLLVIRRLLYYVPDQGRCQMRLGRAAAAFQPNFAVLRQVS